MSSSRGRKVVIGSTAAAAALLAALVLAALTVGPAAEVGARLVGEPLAVIDPGDAQVTAPAADHGERKAERTAFETFSPGEARTGAAAPRVGPRHGAGRRPPQLRAAPATTPARGGALVLLAPKTSPPAPNA